MIALLQQSSFNLVPMFSPTVTASARCWLGEALEDGQDGTPLVAAVIGNMPS